MMPYLGISLCTVMSTIALVAGTEIVYTKESRTITGQMCITDCINNQCITGWHKNRETCSPGDQPALKYYTARRKSDKDFCASRCGKFGYSYEWCYVSEDGSWDYCDPQPTSGIQYKDFTYTLGPCKDDCAKHGSSYLWCNTYWGGRDYYDECYDDKYLYAQARTLDGEPCVGLCGPHDNTNYNWCYNENRKSSYCAPPARDVSKFEKLNTLAFHALRPKLNLRCDVTSQGNRVKRYFDNDADVEEGFVDGHVDAFERDGNGLVTVDVHDPANPVYRYTMIPQSYEDEPELPLVVRARITRRTVRRRGTRRPAVSTRVCRNLERMGMNRNRCDNNNDEIGHIIGFQNGGTNDAYNLAPQPRRLNRDCTHDAVCQQQSVWYWTEMDINQFVRDTGGAVNMTVVVLYRDVRAQPRPAGYVVNLSMYNADGTLHYRCNDYLYSNDPESDSN